MVYHKVNSSNSCYIVTELLSIFIQEDLLYHERAKLK